MNLKLLPDELIIYILSFFSKNEIQYYSLNCHINKKLALSTMFLKFPYAEKRLLYGIVNNYFDKCFKCSNSLGLNYNLVMCYYCTIKLEDNFNYPMICHNCAKYKLNRGIIKYTSCNLCSNLTSHLGITPFS